MLGSVLSKLIKGTKFSLQGLVTVWKDQLAFRLECLLFVLVIIITSYIDVSKLHRLLLIDSVACILIAEIINSAIEKTIDRIGKAHHLLSGQAKDIGSAIVFLAIIMALFTWTSILWKK